ncbi:MAG: Kazal-type serine protease inhibitor family protein, partial [Flavobacteriales bacterium]
MITVATNTTQLCTLTATFSQAGSPVITPASFVQEACCELPSIIQDLPASVTTCQNSNNSPLIVGVSGSDYFINWYDSELPNGPFSLIAGANSTTYYPPTDIAFTMYYRCILTVSPLACEVGDFTGDTYVSTTCAYTVTPGSTTPTFGTFGPYCAGSSIPALPTTSINGITGTWSPAINNQATTTYTFTPNSGQCASTVSTTIVINPVPVVSLSNEFSCTNGLATIAASVSPAGLYDFVWNVPAGAVNPGNVASFTTNVAGTYNVFATSSCINPSQINDQNCFDVWLPVCGCDGNTYSNECYAYREGITSFSFGECTGNENFYCPSAVASTNVTITPSTIPSFGSFGPYCAGDVIPPLPTISTNGITGTWSPAINNQATTTYTFTPNAGQCAQSVSTTITITPLTTPSFTVVNSYCSGTSISALPTTSNNGITGTWSPAINNQATTTYTFTPNAGQCAQSVSTTITITPLTAPSFTVVNSYCSGASIPALPTTSNNGITGTWSPAINNQATTTYTFTPNAGQCAQSVSTTITITPLTTPTFNAVSAACSGSSIPPLPTTSNNGITGTWSPAINNTQTTNYTFTPNAGQCASQVFLTISILPNTTPTFGNFGPYCAGDIIPALPTTSTNGITGTWSPAINNQATTTYTFTPTAGQCALSTSTTIVITPQVVPTFNTPSPYCQDSAFPPLPTTSNNGVNGTWAPTINNQTTTT